MQMLFHKYTAHSLFTSAQPQELRPFPPSVLVPRPQTTGPVVLHSARVLFLWPFFRIHGGEHRVPTKTRGSSRAPDHSLNVPNTPNSNYHALLKAQIPRRLRLNMPRDSGPPAPNSLSQTVPLSTRKSPKRHAHNPAVTPHWRRTIQSVPPP